MHKQVLYGLDLNVGMFKGGTDCPLTLDDVRKGLKASLAHITRASISKDWHCIIVAVLSESSVDGDYARPHAHLVIYGTPCSTITKEIKAYWSRYWTAKRFETIPVYDRIKKQTTDGRLSYMFAQRSGKFYVRPINYPPSLAMELFKCSEAAANEILNDKEGLTKKTLLSLVGYTCGDEDELIVTDYVMIDEFKRPYDARFYAYLGILVDYESPF